MDNERHHRHSIRLKGYDYTRPGAYFVTACTQDRECAFGEIVDARMRLNSAGQIVQQVWDAMPQHHPGVQVGAFAVMPNHIHGIIVLSSVGAPVGAQHAAPLRNVPPMGAPPQSNVSPGSLGAIVRSFKSEVARRINQRRGTPGAPVWQRSYYEHVVHDDDELNRIRQYILDNPAQWSLDRENPRFAHVGAQHAAPLPWDSPLA